MDSTDDSYSLADQQLRSLTVQLEPGEQVLATFVPNLDTDLYYVRGMVALTNRRLLALDPHAAPPKTAAPGETLVWQSWRLDQIEQLRISDRGGLGILELIGPAGRLAHWRFTINYDRDAQQLVQRWDELRRGVLAHSNGHHELELPPSEAPLESPRASSLFGLWRFARGRLRLVIAGFLLTLAATAAGLVPPYLTRPLFDDVLSSYEKQVDDISKSNAPEAEKQQQLEALKHSNDQRVSLVWWYLGGLALASIAAWLLGWAQGAVMAYVSERISADMRNETYAHLQKLSLEFFGGKRTGDLMSRISSDTDRICTFLSDSLVDFSTDCLMIVGTSIVLISVDPLLAAATLIPFPIIAWLIYRVRESLQAGFSKGGRAWAEMTSVLADTIPGIRVVKAFAQEKREADRFRQSNDHVVAANDRVNAVWTFFWPLVGLLNQAGLLVVWAFGIYQVLNQRVTAGTLVMFLAYIGRFYIRLESMSRMLSATQRAAVSAQRIFEILHREPSIAEPLRPVRPDRLRGQIEFNNVAFRYGNRAIIDGLSLSIQPGQMIGLVGPSGAGKSTIVNLVCRFYDVAEGAILVDGTDIRDFPTAEYRRHIGIVLQEPFLFFGTIGENVAYGRPEAPHGEIVAAARAARAHEFVLRLADGYDSLVGERGQSLSGGERQRISIARALLIDPRILILDEATSSVDTETEREIQQALDNLIQGRTTIAIAHRLSTLRKADRLVVLQRGRVVEEGTHDDLLEQQGLYARLYHAQEELTEAVETMAVEAATIGEAARARPPLRGGGADAGYTRAPIAAPSAPTVVGEFELHHDAWGRLALVDEPGRKFSGIEPIRAFPISDPSHYICLCDSDGRELLCIDDLAALPDATRELLEKDLARREFVPVVKRILSVSSRSEPSQWEIETDRGCTHLVLKNSEDVRRLGEKRAVIRDDQGIRYLVPDWTRLDAHSRRILERYL